MHLLKPDAGFEGFTLQLTSECRLWFNRDLPEAALVGTPYDGDDAFQSSQVRFLGRAPDLVEYLVMVEGSIPSVAGNLIALNACWCRIKA